MYELLKNGYKYFDIKEAKKVIKSLREGWEIESFKLKLIDKQKPTDRNKPKMST